MLGGVRARARAQFLSTDDAGHCRPPSPTRSLVHDSGAAVALLDCLARRLQAAAAGAAASGAPDAAAADAALVHALLAATYWPPSCGALVGRGALRVGAALLSRHGCVGRVGKADELLPAVVELLWNLLEMTPREALAAALAPGAHGGSSSGGEPAGEQQQQQQQQQQLARGATVSGEQTAVELVAAAGGVFASLLALADHRQAKELRNDTLAVVQQVVRHRACAAAAAGSGLMRLLLAAGTQPEAGGGSCWLPLASRPTPGEDSSGAPPAAVGGGGCVGAERALVAYSVVVAAAPHAFTRDALDVEMKLMLWSAAAAAAEAEADCLGAAVGGSFLSLLAAHVEPPGLSGSTGASGQGLLPARELCGRLAPEHSAALRHAAWSALLRVAPLAQAAFLGACRGATLLARCIHSGAAAAAGGGFDPSSRVTPLPSDCSGPCDSAASEGAQQAARLVATLCSDSPGGAEAAAALAHEGVVAALLQLLRAGAGAGASGEGGARQAALLALAALCAAGGGPCLKLFRMGRGVALLVEELGRLHAADPALPSPHALAVLGAAWRCVAPDARARAEFLARDGLDALGLLLERGNRHLRCARTAAGAAPLCVHCALGSMALCMFPSLHHITPPHRPPTTRPVLLSLLADVVSDARAHPFFLEWRSPADRAASLPQLLLGVWQEASAAVGLSDASGLLAVADPPLAGARASGGGGGALLPPELGATLAGAACEALGGSGGRSSGGGSAEPRALRRPPGAGAAAYGYLSPERRRLVERIAGAGGGGALLGKVHAVLAAVGFGAVAPLLAAREAAALEAVKAYAALRQGEVWAGIAGAFEAEGLRPSEEDAARLQSGLRSARAAAEGARAAQAALLAAAERGAAGAEAARYGAALAQAAAEAAARGYHKDAAALTMRERLAAKARREAMLARSVVAARGGAVGEGCEQPAARAAA